MAKQAEGDVRVGGVKGIVDGAGNAVDLGHSTNSQDSRCHRKEGKDLCQPPPLGAHSPLYGIEGTAQDVAVLLYLTELAGKHTLGELGGGPQDGGNPHPEKGTGTTSGNGSGNTHDVSCTNGGRKGGTKSGKGRNLTLTPLLLAEDGAEAPPQLGELNPTKAYCQNKARGQNQNNGGDSPHHIIDGRKN